MKRNPILRAAAALAVLAMLAASPAAAQFDKYVALGDSITASFQGLCLVTRNQNASYPLLISQQLGISGFQQPLFAEGTLTSSAANKCLGFVVSGSTIGVGPVSDQLQPTNLGLARPYDNLGIPGATAGDLINITSADPSGNTANQFAYAILRNNFPSSPLNGTNALQQGASLEPDLTTLWVGNNDVLGALLYAVAIDGVTLTPGRVLQPELHADHPDDRVDGRHDRDPEHPRRRRRCPSPTRSRRWSSIRPPASRSSSPAGPFPCWAPGTPPIPARAARRPARCRPARS